MLEKDWFPDLEILEIYGEVNSEKYEQDPPTRIETLNIEKQKFSNRTKMQNSENRNHHTSQRHKRNDNTRR